MWAVRINQAGRDIEDIQSAVSEICIETLKSVHGTQELPSGEKAYWEIGIENADIKQKAYQKQQSEPYAKRAPREAYIDFIDYIKIIKQPYLGRGGKQQNLIDCVSQHRTAF